MQKDRVIDFVKILVDFCAKRIPPILTHPFLILIRFL